MCPVQWVSWGGPRTPRGARCWRKQGLGPAARVAAVWPPQPWEHSGRAHAERGAWGQGPRGRVEAQGASPAELRGGDSGQAAHSAQSQEGGSGGGGSALVWGGAQRPPASWLYPARPQNGLRGPGSPQVLVMSGSGERRAGEAGVQGGLGGLQAWRGPGPACRAHVRCVTLPLPSVVPPTSTGPGCPRLQRHAGEGASALPDVPGCRHAPEQGTATVGLVARAPRLWG